MPLLYQPHALSAPALFAVWPFTRLVHMLTVSLGCLARPSLVHRGREAQPGARPPRRGWARGR
ncbi:respiratory nitrate reductase subunit gamma [Streptomyces sp. NPDC045470]|uniref:respiratory nitrate reductase subunit gamma n=1 Tax=unclassified Streptomyces TaxID=2593676 RepID=UPI0033E771B8